MAVVDAVARIQELTQATAALGGRTAVSPTAAADFAAALLSVLGAPATSGGTGTTAVGSASLDPSARPARADGPTGEDLVAEARTWVGVPYVLGGNDRTGVDCSGLVQQVLGAFGIDAERRVSQQTELGVEVGSLAEAQPGDLIITNNADHVVIYAGDGMIVHAPYEGRTVSYQKNYLDDSDVLTIRRVVPTAGDAGPAAPAGGSAAVAPVAGVDLAAQLSARLSALHSSGGSAGFLTALLGLGLGGGATGAAGAGAPGAGSFGAGSFGAGSFGAGSFGAASTGAVPLGAGPFGAGGLTGSTLGASSDALGTRAGGLGDLVAAAQLRALLGSAA
jgi:cell wall-associated NlpC family hydrolase